MPFITKGKSNLRYILIMVLLSLVADAVIIIYTYLINKQIQEILELAL